MNRKYLADKSARYRLFSDLESFNCSKYSLNSFITHNTLSQLRLHMFAYEASIIFIHFVSHRQVSVNQSGQTIMAVEDLRVHVIYHTETKAVNQSGQPIVAIGYLGVHVIYLIETIALYLSGQTIVAVGYLVIYVIYLIDTIALYLSGQTIVAVGYLVI